MYITKYMQFHKDAEVRKLPTAAEETHLLQINCMQFICMQFTCKCIGMRMTGTGTTFYVAAHLRC